MQKAVPSARSAPSFWMKVVAALLLVCHITSATAIVPFIVTVLAAVDGGHAVIVEYNGSGAGVRLHHLAGDYTPCSCDHHSLAGRVAATLCGSAQTDGDHVLAPATASLNTELKTRDAGAAEAPCSLASTAELTAALGAQLRDLLRGAKGAPAVAAIDSRRRHILHIHHRMLSTVMLLV